jgi:2'-5' RNA ligase
MLRLFVGIALPPQRKLALSTICLGLPGVKWVDPGNYHVTLRFIGEIDEGTAADIDAALATIRQRGFALTVAGLGAFGPPEKPRLLYAGLDKAPELIRLQEKIDTKLARLGLPPEGRRFTPHVTLAKAMAANPLDIARFIAAHQPLRLAEFPVDGFQLVQSHRTKAGAIYEDVAEYPFSSDQNGQ